MNRLRDFFRRFVHLADRPFAAALAVLLVTSMIVTLTGISLTADVLKHLVPDWLLVLLAISYGIGGILLMIGMMYDRGDVEGSGCVLIVSGLIIRAIALVVVLGPSPASVSTVLFYVVFAGACIIRFRQITNGDKIIRLHMGESATSSEG